MTSGSSLPYSPHYIPSKPAPVYTSQPPNNSYTNHYQSYPTYHTSQPQHHPYSQYTQYQPQHNQQQSVPLQQIPGQSYIQYIPYQRTVIEYQQIQQIQYVPEQKTYFQWQERKRIERVPVEREFKDYYTVEHITQYIPRVVPETHIEYVPVEKTENRLEYHPVERQYILNEGVKGSEHVYRKGDAKVEGYMGKSYDRERELKDRQKEIEKERERDRERREVQVEYNVKVNQAPVSHTSYREYPSYPVHHPDLHKVVEGAVGTQSRYESKYEPKQRLRYEEIVKGRNGRE